MHTRFLSENPKGRDYLEDLVIHGRIELETVDWIHLVQDKYIVNRIMKCRFT
jgi:hypothetical protein